MEQSSFRGGERSGGRSGGPKKRPYGGSGQGGGGRDGGRTGGRGGEGQDRFGGGFEGKGRFMRKKICRLCSERSPGIDYKDTERLTKFLTEKGKILPQRISGNCAKHQRMLAKAIKRARHASLIAFQMGV